MAACCNDAAIRLCQQDMKIKRLNNAIVSLRSEGAVLQEMLSQILGRRFDKIKFEARVHSHSFAGVVKLSNWTPSVSCHNVLALPFFVKMLSKMIPEVDLMHARMMSKRMRGTFRSEHLLPTQCMYLVPQDSGGSLQCFDPVLDAWHTLASRLHRHGHSAAVIAGQLYIVGGYGGPVPGSVERFDASAGTWQSLAPMLEQRTGHSASVISGRLYIIGGTGDSGRRLNSAERFDPVEGFWHRLPAMQDRRELHTASVISGRLYVVAGRVYSGISLRSTERLDPITGTWQSLPDMATQRCEHSASVIAGRLYIVGGTRSSSGTVLSTVECFDPGTGAWQNLTPMSERRSAHSASVIDGQLYIVGGRGPQSFMLSSAERFDPIRGTWDTLAVMSCQREKHTASVINGQLYVVGGGNGRSDTHALFRLLERFDPAAGTWQTSGPHMVAGTSYSTAVLAACKPSSVSQ